MTHIRNEERKKYVLFEVWTFIIILLSSINMLVVIVQKREYRKVNAFKFFCLLRFSSF